MSPSPMGWKAISNQVDRRRVKRSQQTKKVRAMLKRMGY